MLKTGFVVVFYRSEYENTDKNTDKNEKKENYLIFK